MILAGSRLGVEAPVTFCENPDLLHKDIGYIPVEPHEAVPEVSKK